MEIQTNRFLLRDFSVTDASAFLAYHADPRNSKFYTSDQGRPEHAQHLLATFQEWAAQQPRQNYQLAVIQRQEPHALVGCAGLRRIGHPRQEAEFGMELAPHYWGRHAYAVEIGRALLDFGFGKLGLRVITGSTVSGNSAITRLAEWFGAEIVATPPGAERLSKQQWSSLDWRITMEQWHHSASRANDGNA